MKEEKIRLLFVCLGNICRSPSAEAVMKKLVKDAGLEARIEIDSAGITGYNEGRFKDAGACGSQGIFVVFDLPSGTSVGLP